MREPVDHEVKLRVRGSEYLALRRLAEDDDRTLSGYIRRVLLEHLGSVLQQEAERDRAAEGAARADCGSSGDNLMPTSGGN